MLNMGNKSKGGVSEGGGMAIIGEIEGERYLRLMRHVANAVEK